MDALLIIITLLLITSGQILQKIAADKASKKIDESFIRSLIYQPATWWAITCMGLGMAFWLAVLYRVEVSQAYPYLGFGYAMVLIASRVWMNEKISKSRWFGVLLIICGIGVLSIA